MKKVQYALQCTKWSWWRLSRHSDGVYVATADDNDDANINLDNSFIDDGQTGKDTRYYDDDDNADEDDDDYDYDGKVDAEANTIESQLQWRI